MKDDENNGFDGNFSSYEPYIHYVTPEAKTVQISNPQSPCTYKLENETRKDPSKPNIWSKMNTIRINVTVTKIPTGGEVVLISSFKPDFWKNQPKTQTIIVNEAGTENSFSSTNEVWIMTRCSSAAIGTGGCVGTFEFEYQKINLPVEEETFPDWSMIITIDIGFSLMAIAYLYFEWRTVYECIKGCHQRGCRRS